MINYLLSSVQLNKLALFAILLIGLILYWWLMARKWHRRSGTPDKPAESWPRARSITLKERFLLVIVLLAISALMLHLSLKTAPPPYAGAFDLVTILDVSASMQVVENKDKITRQERAKQLALDFIAQEKPARSALMLLAGTSFWAMPMSDNMDTFAHFLAAASPFSISDSGTTLKPALELLAEEFCPTSGPCRLARPLVVLLLSDGEIFDEPPRSLIRRLKESGIIFVFAALGKEAAPVPSFDIRGQISGFRVQLNGLPQLSEPNQQLLKELAQMSGGFFWPDGANLPDVNQVLAKPIPRILAYKDLFLLAAFILSFVWLLLRNLAG